MKVLSINRLRPDKILVKIKTTLIAVWYQGIVA